MFKFPTPIELPFSDDNRLIAKQLLYVFRVFDFEDPEHGDQDDDDWFAPGATSPMTYYDGSDEAVTELAGVLLGIREDERSLRYVVAPRRNMVGGWSGELSSLMWPLGYYWVMEVDHGELPRGPFPAPELGNRPAANTGADFVYTALKAIGLQFSDEEFRHAFMLMQRELHSELEFDEPLEDDDL